MVEGVSGKGGGETEKDTRNISPKTVINDWPLILAPVLLLGDSVVSLHLRFLTLLLKQPNLNLNDKKHKVFKLTENECRNTCS
jgi:hypothetical protein